LEELGVAVVILTFETNHAATIYSQDLEINWPVVIDEQRHLYKRYQMHRASFWDLWGPSTWLAYLKQFFKGNLPKNPTGDIHQRGGDVLIDENGIIRLHHVGTGPADRPSVDSIINKILEPQN